METIASILFILIPVAALAYTFIDLLQRGKERNRYTVRVEVNGRELLKQSFSWDGGAVYPLSDRPARIDFKNQDLDCLPEPLRKVIKPANNISYTEV